MTFLPPQESVVFKFQDKGYIFKYTDFGYATYQDMVDDINDWTVAASDTSGSGGGSAGTNSLLTEIRDQIDTNVTLTPGNITGPATGTIPANVKSFAIVNLGEGGLGLLFSPITLSGGVSYIMPAGLGEFGSDAGTAKHTNTAIVVAPASGHIAHISYTL